MCGLGDGMILTDAVSAEFPSDRTEGLLGVGYIGYASYLESWAKIAMCIQTSWVMGR